MTAAAAPAGGRVSGAGLADLLIRPAGEGDATAWDDYVLAHAAGSKRVAILALTHLVELRPRMGKAWQALAHLGLRQNRFL